MRRKYLLGFIRLAAAMLSASFLFTCARQSSIELTLPPVIVRSADDQRIVWVQKTPDGKAAVAVNGKPFRSKFDEISLVVTSPDGAHVAAATRKDAIWRMTLDGMEVGPACEAVGEGGPVFSRDDRRVAYAARIKDRWFAVVDGKPAAGEGYDAIGPIAFGGADGARLAYAAGRDDKWSMVTNDKAGPFYDKVGDPVFSPDGKRLAYTAEDGDKKFIVLDGAPQPAWDQVEKPVFSFDGRHIAYSARKGETSLVIEDGVRIGDVYPMSSIINPVVFGPKDSRVAFAAYTGKGWMVVVDGKAGTLYKDVLADNIMLSPDGKGCVFPAAADNGWIVVQDGREGPAWDRIVVGDGAYSADGSQFVYAGRRGKEWHLVVNGWEQPPLDYSEISPEGGPGFSPDGKYIVFKSRKKRKWYMVVNGQAGPAYDRLYKPVFQAGGVAYLAERDDDIAIVRVLQPYPETEATGPAQVTETRVSDIPRFAFDPAECIPCKEKGRLLYHEDDDD
ncbi:MAG: PD40 domain-containing protein [Spirochaetales bacterium]|nr:PD40 domain-containing protein [Spirochaetales bacterium]